MIANKSPRTLQQAVLHFSDPNTCLAEMVKFRWPDGVVKCPTCGSEKVSFIKARRVWECATKHPKRQFSVKVGTIMEDSAIGLDRWLVAMWLIANAKNGISSYELARSIGVTQKTGWFMLHRIRLAMQDEGGGKKIMGYVEVDETFIGGKARNMHIGKKERVIKHPGRSGKVAVMGLLDRHGNGGLGPSQMRVKIVPNIQRRSLAPIVQENIEHGAAIYTDELHSYDRLSADYIHRVINHAERYVDGFIHTNGCENFWSLLKRTLKGTYVSVEPFHLFRYLDEQCFRFNKRKLSDFARFALTAGAVIGKRLTFAQLTAADTTC
jgi:transposase-like protein